MNDHQRYTEVEILDVSTRDSKDWVGITTKDHGELRCKSNLRTKLKLKKDWKGDLTVWVNPNCQTVCVAFDQKAYQANGVNANPNGQWSLERMKGSNVINKKTNKFESKLNPYENEGFVYEIIEKSTGKAYIGKKSYWNYSRGKRVRQSNWKTYGSSGVDTAEKISNNPDKFKYYILKEAPDKASLNYLEIWFQIHFEVLTKTHNGEKVYYNKTLGSEKWMLTDTFIKEFNR